MIPTNKKYTRATRQSATRIDHILTNCFVTFNFEKAIFKSYMSDHFAISFFLPMTNEVFKTEPIYIHKRIKNNNAIELFRQKLQETDWAEIETSRNPNACYKNIWNKFTSIYDQYFTIKIIKLNTKDIQSPWKATIIKKSSKHKQRLYEKFLKSRIKKAKNAYKNL